MPRPLHSYILADMLKVALPLAIISLLHYRGKTSKKKIISTPNAPGAIGPYSQAVLSPDGATLYVSGCIGLLPSGSFVEGGVIEQTAQCLKNLTAIIEAAGGKVEGVMKTTVLVADINDYKAVNVEYEKVFRESKPARAAFAVKDLPAGALVEVDAIVAM